VPQTMQQQHARTFCLPNTPCPLPNVHCRAPECLRPPVQPIHDFDPPPTAEDREAAAELAARREWHGWEDPARWRIGDSFVCRLEYVDAETVRLTRIA
jgi:hypothetical protein